MLSKALESHNLQNTSLSANYVYFLYSRTENVHMRINTGELRPFHNNDNMVMKLDNRPCVYICKGMHTNMMGVDTKQFVMVKNSPTIITSLDIGTFYSIIFQ